MVIIFPADGIDNAGEEKIGADNEGGSEEDHDIGPELLVEIFAHGKSRDDAEEEEEVASPEKHEKDDDRLDIGAPVECDADVLGGESACGDGSEGVADGIEKRHSAEIQKECLKKSQDDVDDTEDFRRAGDPGSELVAHGFDARNFRVVEGLSADSEHGEDCQREHHDSHAADPVGEAPPEKDAVGKAFDSFGEAGAVHHHQGLVYDGGAGGGEA